MAKKLPPLMFEDVLFGLRAHFGNTTFARGLELQMGGKAMKRLAAEVDDDGYWHVQADVQGSAQRPYRTDIRVDLDLAKGRFDLVSTACTCPVESECKHAAAALLEWLNGFSIDERNGARGGALKAPPEIAEKPVPLASRADEDGTQANDEGTDDPMVVAPSTAQGSRLGGGVATIRTTPLPAALAQWLDATLPVPAKAGASAERKPASVAREAVIFYVLTEDAVMHAVRGRRRPDGTEAEMTGEYAGAAWLTSDRALPAYARPADETLMTLIVNHRDFSLGDVAVRLRGEQGYQLIGLARATGRLVALSRAALMRALVKSKTVAAEVRMLKAPLSIGPLAAASLAWRTAEADALKPVRLAATVAGKPVALVPTAPPMALDIEHNVLFPVSVAMSEATLLRLTSLPPLRANDATAWTFVQDAIAALPDAATVPPLPFAPPAPLVAPKAVLSFVLLEYGTTSGWGRHAVSELHVLPVAQLLFDYDGRRRPADRQGLAGAVEAELKGNRIVATHLRHVRAEREWLRRMPTLLVPAVQVDYRLAQAEMDGAMAVFSLWAIAKDDWATRGAEVLAEAQAAGFEIELDPAFPLSLADIPAPEFGLTPGPETGWFRIALGVTVNGEPVDVAPALARLIGAQKDPEAWLEALPTVPTVLLSVAHKKSKNGAVVVRLSGERVHAILMPVFDWFRGGAVEPLSALQAAMLPDLPPTAVKYLGRDDPRWLAMRDAVKEGSRIETVKPPASFLAALRPYQAHGLAWLAHLYQLRMAGVLADDMGLGKTVQTLAFITWRVAELRAGHAKAKKPTLIVAPTSVTVNWVSEIKRFTPDLKLHTHYGAERALTPKTIAGVDLVLTSYPILQRDEKRFSEIDWDIVVFDEAQMIKNAKSKTYMAAQFLRADMRLALTGTPMENHLGELWALFNLLLPGLLGDLDSFNRVFRHPIEQRAVAEQMQKLRHRVRPFLLRRTREDVLAELPEKTEYTRLIELNTAQADVYESLRTAMDEDIRKVIDKKGLKQSTIHILDALLKLRQVCCDPRLVRLVDRDGRFADAGSAKLDWLMQHVPVLIEEGRSILIFSQFTSMLALIGEALTEAGVEYEILTGDTKDRATPIARFQAGEVKVFLLSLKAGGVGLNLTAADTVIHYDPWWNPAVEAQATARAHRMGQQKPVFVTRLVAQGTLEERMLTLLARKRELAAALLEGEGNALTGITMADVETLLAPISSLTEQSTTSPG
jgi:superfamily II DNA or RNA helicase